MKRLLAACLLAACAAHAQTVAAPPAEVSAQERSDLDQAIAEARSSSLDYSRAIEKHLAKDPNSPQRAALERAGLRAAMDASDNPRIILFGEAELKRQPEDVQALERVTRALLASDAKAASERALTYARRYEEQVRKILAGGTPASVSPADFQEQTTRALARGMLYQARSTGNLGKPDDALALAQRAYDAWPNADAARERARWCERLERPLDAARALADAFSVPDPAVTDAQRERDRGRMGEFYQKAKGSPAGLGDLLLEAYDRNAALIHTRDLRRRALDPNAGLTDPMEFTLKGVDGALFSMASLKGKVAILDFWATWCGPCRAQHPLYAEVRKLFQGNPDVVFLSVNADEERDKVIPFLAEAKWKEPVYYEDGLTKVLKVTSIPTAIVIGKQGAVSARMEGFAPELFVRMLTERIQDALKD
jgi:thiol-disulfide isomerase/thioredoxin